MDGQNTIKVQMSICGGDGYDRSSGISLVADGDLCRYPTEALSMAIADCLDHLQPCRMESVVAGIITTLVGIEALGFDECEPEMHEAIWGLHASAKAVLAEWCKHDARMEDVIEQIKTANGPAGQDGGSPCR